MDKKPLPVGIDDFEKLITGNYYYVDKTDLIKDLLDMRRLTRSERAYGRTKEL